MKVLILSMEYSSTLSGGVGTHCQELAKALVGSGDEVVVMAYTPGSPQIVSEPGLTVHMVPAGEGTRRMLPRVSMVEGMLLFNRDLEAHARRLLRVMNFEPDVIQCYHWITLAAALQLGASCNRPVVSTIQFLSDPPERWWGQVPDPEICQQERFLFQQEIGFITVSESMRALIGTTHGIDTRRVHVVYNAMNPEHFVPRHVDSSAITKVRQTIAPEGGPIILYAGRLNRQKGITGFLEAAVIVAGRMPEVRYVCAGETDSKEFATYMESVPSRYPALNGKLKLLGKLPRPRLAVLYAIADMALVPSTYEPFGYAALEAMFSGVPVIASDAGGLAEIITHGQTGWLVPVREGVAGTREIAVQELASAQLALLADRSYARKLAECGRQRALQQFNADKMADATRAVYLDTMRSAAVGVGV